MRLDLGLHDCPHIKVFRVISRVVRRDPVLAHVVRRWRVWDGAPDEWREPVDGEMPCIELLVGEGEDLFYGPAGFIGPLRVDLIVTTAGNDQAVPLNLYWAIKRAIYPPDDAHRRTIHEDLVEAGAQGQFLVRFTAPSFAPIRRPGGPRAGLYLVGYGSLEVPVIDMLNP